MSLPRMLVTVLALALVAGGAGTAAATTFEGTDMVSVRGPYFSGSTRLECVSGRLRDRADSTVPVSPPSCVPIASLSIEADGQLDVVDLRNLRSTDLPGLRSVNVRAQGAAEFRGSFVRDELVGPVSTAWGGEGDDVLVSALDVRGEEGNDWLTTWYSPWRDTAQLRDLGRARVDGGPGIDVWQARMEEMGEGTTFTLDAQSMRLNDGSAVNAPVVGIEVARVTLVGSHHVFDGSAFPGKLVLEAAADVTFVGGAYADELIGGAGNDTITGSAGTDTVRAGAGDDVVHVRDQDVDTVDCGPGNDTVHVDAVDVVSNCETVVLPPVLVDPTGTGVLPGPATPTVPQAAPQPPDTSAIVGPKKVRKPRRATFTFSSPTPGATFVCRVDKRERKPCASPYKVATKKLKKGKHRLRVWAVVGNDVDVVGSKHVFKVRKKATKGPGRKKKRR
jgi:RTX calcium-binding nonapeptide repeat (4 copies)